MVAPFLLASALLVAAGRPSPAPSAERPSPVDDPQQQAGVVAEALDVIDLLYRERVDPRALLAAAVKGMGHTADPTGASTGRFIEDALKQSRSARRPADQLELLARVLTHLRSQPGLAVDSLDLAQGAIQGMVETLDPAGSVMRAEAMRDSSTAGVGLAFRKEGELKVTASYDDSPAARARVRPGDRILRIDGQLTSEMTLEAARLKLRGPEGSRLVLTVVRGERQPAAEVTLTRQRTPLAIVKANDLGHGIGCVRIGDFTAETPGQLRTTLTELERKGTTGLVIDLRDNAGGLLASAIEVAGLFLEKGALVASTTGRTKYDKARYEASGSSLPPHVPISLLVNQGSMSGTELVAAALQHWKRAHVVGSRTPGTSSVQTIIPLRRGSFVLTLTTGLFLTPNGTNIDGTGITPDVVVQDPETEFATSPGEGASSVGWSRFGDADSDVPLQRAIELVRARIGN